jgi:hypothetical protein
VELHEADNKIGHELLQVEAIHVVRFLRPEDGKAEVAWGRYANLFNEARALGKTVLASGIRQVDELAVLMRLGVHYVQGDALGFWSSEWNFDFTTAA